MQSDDVFERLLEGRKIPFDDPQSFRLREESFKTKKYYSD